MTLEPVSPFTFSTSKSIIFGAGVSARSGEIALRALGKRVLLVTDPGIVRLNLHEGFLVALRAQGIDLQVYDQVVADPPVDIVLAAVSIAREMAATGIVGFGGGSSLDVAKLVALLSSSGETLQDIYGVGKVTGSRLPLMLVPTTSGTGSEVTPVAIVTTGTSEKMGVVSSVLLPDIALLDPELTYKLPPAITAATGIDAMVHAIEAYASTNPNNNPMSRGLALQALQLLSRAIEVAVLSPTPAARSEMLLGSMLAGQAFANSPVAAVHALALPHVLRFNAQANAQVYADLAPIVIGRDVDGAGPAELAHALADALADLAMRCGLPTRLREVGIPEDALPRMASDAMNQTRLLGNNPRKVAESDAFDIYRAAW
jgi:alcohol dehydrogenase class IV